MVCSPRKVLPIRSGEVGALVQFQKRRFQFHQDFASLFAEALLEVIEIR